VLVSDRPAICFEPTTNYLWCVSLTRGAIAFDITTGEARHKLSLGRVDLSGVAIDPTGRWVATIVDDRTVRVWDFLEKQPISTAITTKSRIVKAALSPQALWIALASENGDIEVFPVFHLNEQE